MYHTLAAPTPGNWSLFCDTPIWQIDGINIYNPTLAPSAIAGALIGFLTFIQASKLRNWSGSYIYSRLFFFFGVMNTMGFITNCLVHNFPNGQSPANLEDPVTWPALLDGICSSTVPYLFILATLVDLNIFRDRTCLMKLLVLVGFIGLTVGYIYTFMGLWPLGFYLMYVILNKIGMLFFFVGALLYHFSKCSVVGIPWLVLALFFGVVGFEGLFNYEYLCENYGMYFSSEVVWYFCSSAALFCLRNYFFSTGKLREEQGLPLQKQHYYCSEQPEQKLQVVEPMYHLVPVPSESFATGMYESAVFVNQTQMGVVPVQYVYQPESTSVFDDKVTI